MILLPSPLFQEFVHARRPILIDYEFRARLQGRYPHFPELSFFEQMIRSSGTSHSKLKSFFIFLGYPYYLPEKQKT